MVPFVLQSSKSQLLLVDMQEKLLPAMQNNDEIAKNAKTLLKAADLLGIPVKYTEHYPSGLGPTVEVVRQTLPPSSMRFEKVHFSCWAEAGFADFIRNGSRDQIVMAGIESHICVLSTALDLLKEGYQVAVSLDAVGSRRSHHHESALRALASAGALVVPTETIVYQWLARAATEAFRAMLPYFKGEVSK
ncbi:MAG TPA: isochorismatase family protein [Synergistaceae bacterium]|nr:isochorismatase family protein [Synergistaceae bacterium]